METKMFANGFKAMADHGIQAAETASELFVHVQQQGAEHARKAVENGMKRYHGLCMDGIQAWTDGMAATTRMTQDALQKLRTYTTEPAAPKAKK